MLKIGVFDSGLGGLTIVKAIYECFKGSDILYIADTAYLPYGCKTKKEIKSRCIKIVNFLIKFHNIEVLIIACNTATSAIIEYLRKNYTFLIIIGIEPGIKPALKITKTFKLGILATSLTLKGEKYQQLVKNVLKDKKVTMYEQACPGLVEQIEMGKVNCDKTVKMLKSWLLPMKEKKVDTIILGCTHYTLVSNKIKNIMGNKTNLIQTNEAIVNRLTNLTKKTLYNINKDFSLTILYTGKINKNMIKQIFQNSINNNIVLKECKI